MSSGEGVGRISLSRLKGRSLNQSVPIISFKFSPGSDDLINVGASLSEEKETSCTGIPETSPEKEKAWDEICDDFSKQQTKIFGPRSSSLDESSSLNDSSVQKNEVPSIFSRITRTFEDKLNEMRSEKCRDQKYASNVELIIPGDEKSSLIDLDCDHLSIPSSSNSSKASPNLSENKEIVEGSLNTTAKTKTSLVQDITEQTNKLKADFNKNIRPKFSELRHRKLSKDNAAKPKSSIFHSRQGKEEGVSAEVLSDCLAVERAVEAHENEKQTDESISQKSQLLTKKKSETNFINKDESSSYVLAEEMTILFKENVIKFLQDALNEYKSLTTKLIIIFIVICFILPLPRFLAGVVFGIAVSSIAFMFIFRLMMPKNEEANSVIEFPDVAPVVKKDICLYEGLMNELDGEYFPEEYHVSLTHTVLLRLQGSMLKIDNSRKRINKHARPNEELKYGCFVNHRVYNLSGSEVVLLPKNLPRKWLWSRKYPIVIRLVSKNKKKSGECSTASTPIGSCPESEIYINSQDITKNSANSEFSEANKKQLTISSSSVDLNSYEEVTDDMCEQSILCFFARTDREKDDWFRRFVNAAELPPGDDKISLNHASFLSSTPENVPSPMDSTENLALGESAVEDKCESEQQETKPSTSTKDFTFDQFMTKAMLDTQNMDDGIRWFNAFVSRVLFDFLKDEYWANKIQERVQRKLSKLHIPYFVGEIVVSDVKLGNCIPQLHSAGIPVMDERGLWVDFIFAYAGSFRMTLETKLDLMKLKARSSDFPGSRGAVSTPPSPGEDPPSTVPNIVKGRAAYCRSPSSDCVLRNVQYDTDTDDSVESSSEDDFEEDDSIEKGGTGGPASKRILRIVDSVAASKYFQQASEWRLLQKAIKGVSRTRIELGVEVRRLNGTLTLNIPSWPSDRLWYGFRGSPDFVMVAKPCLGDRQLDTLPFLADFIQKQLKVAFEKIFVLPNMDDFVIPVMTSHLLGQKFSPRPPWEHVHNRSRNGSVSLSANASPFKYSSSFNTSQSFQKLSEMTEEY